LSDAWRSVHIAGVREIADRFHTWFVDAYGVLHDGSAAFPGAVEALTLARRAGVTIVIVTNSGQRVDAVAARLAEAGIAPDRYDHIMSSGELSWRHIAQLDVLSRLFLLYPGGGPLWLNQLRNPIVDDLPQADLIVAADMPHRTEEAARAGDLPALLETAAALCRIRT
jgi:ribonucleotide monophosphatase NagD (HAD superfamily)